MSNQTISTDAIDGITQRLNSAHAIVDLLSECNQDQLCKGTLSGIAYTLMELLSETKYLVTGKTEVQP